MAERIRERDLVIPALRAAASHPSRAISTTELIKVLQKQFAPSGEDAEILHNRHDTKFSQKVRNLVSHRSSPRSMFSRGYALYDEGIEGIRVTDSGLDAIS